MKIIATAAQLNSGKDVFSDHLAKVLNAQKNDVWVRGAFANAVKDTFCSSFGVDRDFIEKWKRVPEPPPGMKMPIRQSLQFIGDGFRQIVPDIWIDIALRGDHNMILSDSRYVNEAKAVKKKNGFVFLMYRPGYLNNDPNPSEAQIKPLVEFCVKNLREGFIPKYDKSKSLFGHDIPEDLQYYDYFLVNNGSIEDLHRKTEEVIAPALVDYFKGY